ncbi:MAG TPA: endolytic transglycosylase MltG [Steroidobacteraceae bacterium]|nr:endolytic transglycosylase MltG [Steroidobacteraceae bacterium]
MNRVLRVLWVLAWLSLLAGAGAEIWLNLRSLDAPLRVAAPMPFRIPAGSRLSRVAADLAARGVLERPRALVLYARWKGTASAIKAGEYEIEPGTTPRGLLDKLVSGQVLLHSLTIVDGWRVQDLLAAMRGNPDVLATLPATPVDIMGRLGAPGVNAEGQFLPETYRFPSGTPDVEILRQAHAALMRTLNAAWANRDPAIPLRSIDELLIMASIVEKESGLPDELPKIAGLYLHRLKIGMRLQADPTVIYGLGDAYDGDVHSVDLRTDGPYNTYTRAGLPPTPIALPGAAAIEATAHPESTSALYFVASGRGDGSHVFSATLDEHNAAVARYVARQRQRAASESAR